MAATSRLASTMLARVSATPFFFFFFLIRFISIPLQLRLHVSATTAWASETRVRVPVTMVWVSAASRWVPETAARVSATTMCRGTLILPSATEHSPWPSCQAGQLSPLEGRVTGLGLPSPTLFESAKPSISYSAWCGGMRGPGIRTRGLVTRVPSCEIPH
jgi:hypothetical protein